MKEVLHDTARSPLTDWAWRRQLFPYLGGLGLGSASFHAPVAFLCSFAASLNLVQSILGYHSITPPQVQDSVLAMVEVATFTSWHSIDIFQLQNVINKVFTCKEEQICVGHPL